MVITHQNVKESLIWDFDTFDWHEKKQSCKILCICSWIVCNPGAQWTNKSGRCTITPRVGRVWRFQIHPELLGEKRVPKRELGFPHRWGGPWHIDPEGVVPVPWSPSSDEAWLTVSPGVLCHDMRSDDTGIFLGNYDSTDSTWFTFMSVLRILSNPHQAHHVSEPHGVSYVYRWGNVVPQMDQRILAGPRVNHGVVVCGPPCSLFVWISAGTHCRRVRRFGYDIFGNTKLRSVRMANAIVRNFAPRL